MTHTQPTAAAAATRKELELLEYEFEEFPICNDCGFQYDEPGDSACGNCGSTNSH